YGPLLRTIREEAGLSQAELGSRANVAGSQINKLETNVNQPTLATALAIAEALGRPIADFIPEGESLASAPGEQRTGKPGRPRKPGGGAARAKGRKKKGE